MKDIKNLKKAAIALFIAVSVMLLLFTFQTLRDTARYTSGLNAPSVATALIGVLILAASMVFALTLLSTIRKDETPFSPKNVRHLKVIAALLVILEPYLLAAQWCLHRFYPIVLSDGTTVETHSTMGGTIFAAGFVVYCVALVFEYGIILQQQADETL